MVTSPPFLEKLKLNNKDRTKESKPVYTHKYDHLSTPWGSSDDGVIALKASARLNDKTGGTTSGVF